MERIIPATWCSGIWTVDVTADGSFFLLKAVRRAAEQRQQAAETSSAAGDERGARIETPGSRKPATQPLVKIKQKGTAEKRHGRENPDGEAIKRHRAEEESPPDTSDPSVLAGLMDGYASDSESDS